MAKSKKAPEVDPRPSSVHLMGREFSVTYDLDNGNFGSCNVMDGEIEVREGLGLMEEQDTLLHEVMHGIWHVMDIQLPKYEEHVVRKMATGLALVLKQNPELPGRSSAPSGSPRARRPTRLARKTRRASPCWDRSSRERAAAPGCARRS